MVVLDADAALILSHCRGARTLQGHADAVAHARVVSTTRISEVVRQLVASDVLEPLEPISSAPLTHAPDPRRHDELAVVVITADRPAAFRRCLKGVLRRIEDCDRRTRLVVIDGSREHAAEVRAIANACSADAPLQYVGPTEAEGLQRGLATAGIPDTVLCFALSLSGIGSKRNLATLVTAGTDYVAIDDDVVPDVWASSERDVGIVCGDHTDLRCWSFHPSRRAALASLPTSGPDIGTAHCRFLGKSLAGLLEEYRDGPDLRYACSHLLRAIVERQPATVRVTVAGVAGDSGRDCPYPLLFRQGHVRNTLLRDRVAFQTALASREVRVIASTPIVTHEHSSCATYCMGVANRQAPPPFLPHGRGEDTVFGAMLEFCDRHSLLVHLPYGVIHDSGRAPAWTDAIPSARHTTMAELVLGIVDRAACASAPASEYARLRSLSCLFEDISRLKQREFLAFLTEIVVKRHGRCLATADALLGQRTCPDYWRAAILEYRRVLSESIRQRAFSLPLEFGEIADVALRSRRVQDFLASFAQLLRWWPEIWEQASTMACDRGTTPVRERRTSKAWGTP